MQVEISKKSLEYELRCHIIGSYASAVVESGLIGAKWVEVRKDRKCRHCGMVIPKGTLALTASVRDSKGRKHRTWICYTCREHVYKQLRICNKDCYEVEMDEIYYEMEE